MKRTLGTCLRQMFGFVAMSARGLLVLGCASLSACSTSTSMGAVGIDRQQLFIISEAQVESLAAQNYEKLVSGARDKGRANNDPEIKERVDRIARRLIPQTTAFRPDAVNWNWEVNVLESKEVNAFCMAGGKIVVLSGLIDKLEPSDDELASVLGHEIGHALREHTRESVSNRLAATAALAVFAAATKADSSTVQLADLVSQVSFTLPNSREQETEADHIGLELMARAGYDPHAAVSMMKKLATVGGERIAFLSNHPQSSTRAQDLDLLIPRVLPLYAASEDRSPVTNDVVAPKQQQPTMTASLNASNPTRIPPRGDAQSVGDPQPQCGRKPPPPKHSV